MALSIVPTGDTTFYRSPFLRDFWHLNVAMMTSNNALVPDPDKEDILASKPIRLAFPPPRSSYVWLGRQPAQVLPHGHPYHLVGQVP